MVTKIVLGVNIKHLLVNGVTADSTKRILSKGLWSPKEKLAFIWTRRDIEDLHPSEHSAHQREGS